MAFIDFFLYPVAFLSLFLTIFYLLTFLEKKGQIRTKINNHAPFMSIIVPAYNKEGVIKDTINSILNADYPKEKLEIIIVDDGSTDKTWDLISKIHQQNNRVKGLKFSKNFGQESALLAGLLNNKDRVDGVITIDADLQDDVSIIERFVDAYANGYDIVYGVREHRQVNSIFKKYPSP